MSAKDQKCEWTHVRNIQYKIFTSFDFVTCFSYLNRDFQVPMTIKLQA